MNSCWVSRDPLNKVKMADRLKPNIIKKVLYAGEGEIPNFPEGSKVLKSINEALFIVTTFF